MFENQCFILFFISLLLSQDNFVRKPIKNINARALLSFIPDDKFIDIVDDINIDFQVKNLYGSSMFYLLLYGLLESSKIAL